jgi:raffinose/stachyose/melibiose transport system permease protein
MAERSLKLPKLLPSQDVKRTDSRGTRNQLGRLLRRLLPALVLVVITVFVLYPFVFVIFTSLKTDKEVTINPLGLPQQWLWQNYREAWVEANFGIYFKNSVIILIPVVATVVFTSILAGYALSRLRFRGSRVLLVYFIAGLGLPLEAVLIPLYIMMKDAKLLNTYWSVMLPQVGLLLPFGVLIMSGFFAQLPSELIDAAKVDGATDWQTLWRVLVPVASPAIVSLVVFASLWTWNSFFLPTIMLTKDSVRTLPLGLVYFIGEYQTQQHLLAAGALITATPIIILYLIFQRQFVRGITVGSFK